MANDTEATVFGTTKNDIALASVTASTVGRTYAMLEQHIVIDRYYRKRLKQHLENHPGTRARTRWVWATMIGAGWAATTAISVIALIS